MNSESTRAREPNPSKRRRRKKKKRNKKQTNSVAFNPQLYRSRGCRLSKKLVPSFAGTRMSCAERNGSPRLLMEEKDKKGKVERTI
jgi:hypothetical protein